jgi:streptomycin 6-kinase
VRATKNAQDVEPRLHERAVAWGVDVDDILDTPSSLVAFGHRGQQPVVLKVIKRPGEEWLSGPVLEAFGSRGVVGVLDHSQGALLLERLVPGTPLLGDAIGDDRATAVIADVIVRMSPDLPPATAPTVESWSETFQRYQPRDSRTIPASLVDAAHRTYSELCASQRSTRLLHGDLHHHNVLFDGRRGWIAIDPKGVVGELAYEVGAALRNPAERPELFAAPATVQRRAGYFARTLQLDMRRVLGWAFAQAVLSALWELEDEGVLRAGGGWLALAKTIHPMLEGHESGDSFESR